MYGRVLKAALLSLCLGLVASKNLCAQDAARFGIYGSNTIGARLMPNLVEAYAASAGASTERSASNDPEQVELNLTNRTGAPLAQVDIRSHGSGTGIPALIDGKASIAMLSRPISEKETLALQQAGLPDLRSAEYAHVLAMDGILVFVSPKNPLATLSLDEIAGIFAGTIRDWGAVGGVPGSINVYARDNKSGTFDTFNSLVLRTRNLALRKDAKQFESSEELSDEVARDPNGIGFSGFAYLRSAKALDIATECGITSKPTTFNVKSEEYPLSRRLFLYTKPLANGTVPANVLRYALSMDARHRPGIRVARQGRTYAALRQILGAERSGHRHRPSEATGGRPPGLLAHVDDVPLRLEFRNTRQQVHRRRAKTGALREIPGRDEAKQDNHSRRLHGLGRRFCQQRYTLLDTRRAGQGSGYQSRRRGRPGRDNHHARLQQAPADRVQFLRCGTPQQSPCRELVQVASGLSQVRGDRAASVLMTR